jgi:hypothetical protein
MTLRRQSWLVALAVIHGLVLPGCGGSSSATLTAIAVTPSPLRVALGGVGQLVVNGINSDGTRAPIVAGLTFSSDASAVAAVSSSGVVTGLAEGSATITAAASGLTARVTVTVSSLAPTLLSIDIIPSSAQVAIRGTEQLTVSGMYSDFSTFDVTAGSTFVSSSPGVATVSAGGLVTGVSAGSTTIVATHTVSGRIATATIFVVGGRVSPTLVSGQFHAGPGGDAAVDRHRNVQRLHDGQPHGRIDLRLVLARRGHGQRRRDGDRGGRRDDDRHRHAHRVRQDRDLLGFISAAAGCPDLIGF